MLSYIYNKTGKKCGLIIFKVVHAGMRAKSDNFHVYNIASSQSPKPPKYRRRGRWRRKRNRDTQWLKICMIFKNLSFWMFCIVFCFCLLCFLIGKMRILYVMMLLHFMRQYHTLKFSRARILISIFQGTILEIDPSILCFYNFQNFCGGFCNTWDF